MVRISHHDMLSYLVEVDNSRFQSLNRSFYVFKNVRSSTVLQSKNLELLLSACGDKLNTE